MLSGIQAEDGEERCQAWIAAIAAGKFSFGPAEIAYHAKGPASWKHAALGTERNTDHWWERFDYTEQFLRSDWKMFHDAVQSHQFDILRKVLPRFGISIS